MVASRIGRGASEGGSNGRDWSMGSSSTGQYKTPGMLGFICADARGRARSALFSRVFVMWLLSYEVPIGGSTVQDKRLIFT